MLLSWLCGVLAVLVIALLLKIHRMKKCMKKLCTELEEHLSHPTNTLLGISSNDRQLKQLTAELNRQLRRLRKQYRYHMNGNQRLKTAVTGMSHDLRTPLTAICGYLDLLEQEDCTEDVKRWLSIIRNRVDQMIQLSEELFQYSLTEITEHDDRLEPVALNDVLEESIAGFYAVLKRRGIEPVVHMPQRKIVRSLNAAMLTRVLANLMNNALKYSDGDLEICLKDTGDILFINTASGLDQVQVARLFDRFYTVHHADNATGLGLEIARSLLERMHGSISAEYAQNRLCICIRLPNTAEKTHTV